MDVANAAALAARGFHHIPAPTEEDVFDEASSHPRSRGGRALCSYFAYLNLMRIAMFAGAGLDNLVFASINDPDCGFGRTGHGTARIFGHRFVPQMCAKDAVRLGEFILRRAELDRPAAPYDPSVCQCSIRLAGEGETRTPGGLLACATCLPFRSTRRMVLYLRMVVGNFPPEVLAILASECYAIVGVTLAFTAYGEHRVAGLRRRTEEEIEEEPGPSPWAATGVEAVHSVYPASPVGGGAMHDRIHTVCDNTDYDDYHHGELFTGPCRVWYARPDGQVVCLSAATHFVHGTFASGHCAFTLQTLALPAVRARAVFSPDHVLLAPPVPPLAHGQWLVGATVSHAKLHQVLITVSRGDATLQAVSLKVSASLPEATGYTRAALVQYILTNAALVDQGRDAREAAIAAAQPGVYAYSAEAGRRAFRAIRGPGRAAAAAVGASADAAVAVLAPAGEQLRGAIAAAGGVIAAPIARVAAGGDHARRLLMEPADALPALFAGQSSRDIARRTAYALNWALCFLFFGPFGFVAGWAHYAACELGRRALGDSALGRTLLIGVAAVFVAVGGPFGWANGLAMAPMLLSAAGGGVYAVWLAPLLEEAAKRYRVGSPTADRLWTTGVCFAIAFGDCVSGGSVSWVQFMYHVLVHKTLADMPLSVAICVHGLYNAVVLTVGLPFGMLTLNALPSLTELTITELAAAAVAMSAVGATTIYALPGPAVWVGLRVDEVPVLAPDLGGDVVRSLMEEDGRPTRRYYNNFLTGNSQALVAHTGPQEVLHAAISRHVPVRPEDGVGPEVQAAYDASYERIKGDPLARFKSMSVRTWTRERTAADRLLFRAAAEDLVFDGVQDADHRRSLSRKPESFAPGVFGPGGAWAKGYKGRNIVPNRPKRTIGVGRVTKSMGARFLRRVFRGTAVSTPIRADPAWYSATLQGFLDLDCDGAIVFGDDVVLHFAGAGDRFECTDVKSMDAFMNSANTGCVNDLIEVGCAKRACEVAAFWDACALQFLQHNVESVPVAANGCRFDAPGMNASGDGDTWLKNSLVAGHVCLAAFALRNSGLSEDAALHGAWGQAGFEITRDTCPLMNVVFCQMVNFPCGEHAIRGRLVRNRFAPHVARLFRSTGEVDRGRRARDDVAATGQSLAPFWRHLPFFRPVVDAMMAQGDASRGATSKKFIRPMAAGPPVEPYAEEYYCSMLGLAVETWRDFCVALTSLGRVPGAVFVMGDVYEACVGYLADPVIVWC